MLNELAEFELYTLPINDDTNFEKHRLKYLTLIKGKFSGLERTMTIIARKFIFESGVENFNEDKIKNILKAWCGFKFDEQFEDAKKVANWLPNYIRYAFLSDRIKKIGVKLNLICSAEIRAQLAEILNQFSPNDSYENLKAFATRLEEFFQKNNVDTKNFEDELKQVRNSVDALNDLSERNKIFSKSVFSGMSKNDFRAITFDRVIANALLAGELKNFGLVCAIEPFESKKIAKFTPKAPNSPKKLLPADEDQVLKMTAEYLLKKRTTNQDFVETNDSNMINWLIGNKKPGCLEREKYKLRDSKEEIFIVRAIDGIDALKIKVHPDWAKFFSLVEESELNTPENRGRIFFKDTGFSDYFIESGVNNLKRRD